ncbi:MAG: hypothetical protein KAH22_04770 [Thiotrichaceae bacterium]|nr:hypothetical protein [Thiotrichaceae bacterium]
MKITIQLRTIALSMMIGVAFIAPAKSNSDIDVSAQQLQAAIEAFGVSANDAKEATRISLIIIESQKVPTTESQKVAVTPDDLLDLSPY